jgi:hypothetical protein
MTITKNEDFGNLSMAGFFVPCIFSYCTILFSLNCFFCWCVSLAREVWSILYLVIYTYIRIADDD